VLEQVGACWGMRREQTLDWILTNQSKDH